MSNKLFQRTWVSPLVALSFAVVGITGIMMLFHVHFAGMKSMHEWMGVLMVAAGAVHIILNWRVFLEYLKNPVALVTVVAGATLGVALLLVGGGEGPEHGRPPMGPGPWTGQQSMVMPQDFDGYAADDDDDGQ